MRARTPEFRRETSRSRGDVYARASGQAKAAASRAQASRVKISYRRSKVGMTRTDACSAWTPPSVAAIDHRLVERLRLAITAVLASRVYCRLMLGETRRDLSRSARNYTYTGSGASR